MANPNTRVDAFDAEVIVQYGVHDYIQNIECFQTIDSTNNYATSLFNQGVRINSLIVASSQTAGKGRKGRTFYSPEPGLYASLLFYPNTLAVANMSYVTICMALAVCEAIEDLYEVQPEIKWLNDIYLDGKKICGILTESKIKTKFCEYIVVGCGVNVFDLPLDATLQSKVGSLEKITGKIVDINLLIATIMNKLNPYLEMIEQEDFSFIKTYESKNFLIGRKVILDEAAEQVYTAIGINDEGKLIVQNALEEKILNAEEVSLYGWE